MSSKPTSRNNHNITPGIERVSTRRNQPV